MRNALSLTACALFAGCFVYAMWDRGGPYFDRPATVVEHVARIKHDLRDSLLVLPLVRPMLPWGAQVTCFRPKDGKYTNDTSSFHAAVVLLPHQNVLPPFSAAEDLAKKDLVEYVIAIDEPFTHPAYHLEAEFPAGRLYKVVR